MRACNFRNRYRFTRLKYLFWKELLDLDVARLKFTESFWNVRLASLKIWKSFWTYNFASFQLCKSVWALIFARLKFKESFWTYNLLNGLFTRFPSIRFVIFRCYFLSISFEIHYLLQTNRLILRNRNHLLRNPSC